MINYNYINKLDKTLFESIDLAFKTIFESSKEEYKIPGIKVDFIKTDIKPEERTLKNRPKYSDGKLKVKFQDWLLLKKPTEYKDVSDFDVAWGMSPDKTCYGWSHRAVYGFKIGDKVKEGDCAYEGKEYTIKTELDCVKTAISFSKSVS